MKKKILSIGLLILLCTSCQERTSDLDNIILECYDPKYQEEGFDIRSIIDEYENILVREGVLKDGSGKSYLEVWRKLYSDKDFRLASRTFREYDPSNKVDFETVAAVFMCEYEMIESLKEKDPKWHTVFPDSESTESDEYPDQLYQAITGTLSEEDLNSYYFRLRMFHHFDGVNSNFIDRASMTSDSNE